VPGQKPILSDLLPRLKGALAEPQSDEPGGFTIVVFDERYLTEEFIPQLAKQRFGSKSSLLGRSIA
jgi:hypothetical protein